MSSTPSDKQAACNAIDRESEKLRALSLDIWENPELFYQEHHAHQVITDFLEERGFQVERKFVLDTAFRVVLSSKDATADGPHIGVMCEYDALPGIGHACGHNLIAILGVSVALGIREAFERAGVKGKLTILGCPAEEGGGGKIDLINAGAFLDLDLAMMAHPSQFNVPEPTVVAMVEVDIHYQGMESHASSSPWDGLNALDAAVLCYQNVSCLRQQMKPTWRVHGIFTQAGEKPNILPGVAALQFYARAPSSKELKVLKEKLIRCVEGAALATGCKVVYEFGEKPYESLISNERMASLYQENGESLGILFENNPTALMKDGGSTDMGNVSRVLPSIHPQYSLNTTAACHSPEFRDIAGTEESHKVTLEHAKALAMAALDIYRDPSVVTKMKDDFKTQMANEN